MAADMTCLRPIALAWLAGAASFTASPTRADENQVFSSDYLLRVGRDIVEVGARPFHWTGPDWLIAGGILGATYGAYTVDNRSRWQARRLHGNSLHELSEDVTHFGDWKYEVPLLSGCWLGGLVTGNVTMNRIAADGAEASLIAAGLFNPLIVWLTGRDLPNKNRPAYRFHPFSNGRVSFPSGHTAEAFAVASVVDDNLRPQLGYAQTPVLYAIASSVGFSRMLDQAHYFSDVVLGAGIGWAVGSWVSHKSRNVRGVSVVPAPGGLLLAGTIAY
jgi:membrane-associated phospholipid phosphatase